MNDRLMFERERHEYSVDGEIIPSVTQIVRFIHREYYQGVRQCDMDRAADRGTRVHAACEAIDLTGSAEVTDDIEPYVAAYVKFLQEHDVSWQKIEYPLFDAEMLYAGTLDRYGVVNGRTTIIDLKTTSVMFEQQVQAQINGYRIMAEHNGLPVDKIAALHLRKDGTYRLKYLSKDESSFMACYLLHQTTKRKRRKKKDGITEH